MEKIKNTSEKIKRMIKVGATSALVSFPGQLQGEQADDKAYTEAGHIYHTEMVEVESFDKNTSFAEGLDALAETLDEKYERAAFYVSTGEDEGFWVRLDEDNTPYVIDNEYTDGEINTVDHSLLTTVRIMDGQLPENIGEFEFNAVHTHPNSTVELITSNRLPEAFPDLDLNELSESNPEAYRTLMLVLSAPSAGDLSYVSSINFNLHFQTLTGADSTLSGTVVTPIGNWTLRPAENAELVETARSFVDTVSDYLLKEYEAGNESVKTFLEVAQEKLNVRGLEPEVATTAIVEAVLGNDPNSTEDLSTQLIVQLFNIEGGFTQYTEIFIELSMPELRYDMDRGEIIKHIIEGGIDYETARKQLTEAAQESFGVDMSLIENQQ